jgi:hypothetical protein
MAVMKIALLLLCIAAAGLGLAACGSDDDPTGSSSGDGGSRKDRMLDGALKFSRCMREHGVDFPDPKSDGKGRVMIGPGPGSRFNPDDPKVRKANDACDKYMEEVAPSAEDRKFAQENRGAFVAYAQCMRKEGVTGFPDPSADGGFQIKRKRGESGPGVLAPDSPVFKNADKVCHKLLAEVDKKIEERQR